MSNGQDLGAYEVGQDVYHAVKHAQHLAATQDVGRLERDLPTFIDIGDSLAVHSRVNLALLDQAEPVVVKEAAELLDELAQALLPILRLNRRGSAVVKIVRWAYLACVGLRRWDGAAQYSIELAQLSFEQKKLTEAKDWLRRAAEANRKAKSDSFKASIELLKGQVAITEGDYSQAVRSFTVASKLFRKQKNNEELLVSLLEKGKANYHKNKLVAAQKDLEEVAELGKQTGSEQYLDEAYYFSGLVNYHRGNFEVAQDCLDYALSLAQQQSNRALQADIQATLQELARNPKAVKGKF